MKKYSAVWDDQTYVYVGTAEEVMNLYRSLRDREGFYDLPRLPEMSRLSPDYTWAVVTSVETDCLGDSYTEFDYVGEYWIGVELYNHNLVETDPAETDCFRWEGDDLYCGTRRWNDSLGEFHEVM